jgi:hypothetical protein
MNQKHRFTRLALAQALGLGLLVMGVQAFAADVKVDLSGDQEVPKITTGAKGSGTITVGDDKSVKGSVTTSGISATAAHIHEAEAGKNGGVIIPLTKNGDNGWSVPAGAKLTDAQFDAYKKGGLYVNVHSAANPGGEIRGQIKP